MLHRYVRRIGTAIGVLLLLIVVLLAWWRVAG